MGRLDGKIAVVTGASSGFGRAISLRFAREGAKIVILDLQDTPAPNGHSDEFPGEKTADVIKNQIGGDACFVQCDISKEDNVIAAFAEAVKAFGTFDILVNCAGVFRGGAMYKIPMEDVDFVMGVNFRGTWMCCKEALKVFVPKKKGKIVNLASSAALRGYPGQGPYNASKGAVADMTWVLAYEYGGKNINVNAICPTYCKTSLTDYSWGNEEFREIITDAIPMHRWGTAADVANAALFLASDESDFITGVLLPVDGGEIIGATKVKDYALLLPELEELI